MESRPSDNEIMTAWYKFVAVQPDSVDALLRLVRDRRGETLRDQQHTFGATDDQFTRLRGFLAPRPERFKSDALAIATACQLTNPFAFVQTLVLARNLSKTPTKEADSNRYYRAAFDALDQLDEWPDEE